MIVFIILCNSTSLKPMSRASTLYTLLIISALSFLWLAQANFQVIDEVSHLDQVQSLAEGNDRHLPAITTFIYLHQAYAWVGQKLNIQDLFAYRWINLFFATLLALCIYWICLLKEDTPDWKMGAQLFFLPIAFPYYTLVYTDIIALLLLLMCAQMMNDRRFIWSALFGVLAVLIRQPSLIWVGFLALMAFQHLYWTRQKPFFTVCLNLMPYLIVGLSFAVFFAVNDSVALGDKNKHSISINISNVYFMVLVACWVFLPLIISRLFQAWNLIKNNPLWWLVFASLLPVYIMTFDVTHEYNAPAYNQFTRNFILNTMADSWVYKSIVYTISCIGVTALYTIRMRLQQHQILYLAMPLSVIPMPLIEQRYYMVGFTLWQLWRKRLDSVTETFQMLWLIAWSMIIYYAVAQHWIYF